MRKLDVTKMCGVAGENRVIIHLQLTDWPDRSAPGHAGHLVQLVQLTHVMLNTHTAGPQGQGGPLLVHCSAGVGRTGTFIAVFKLVKDYMNSNVRALDFKKTVLEMRNCRMKMVQKKE